MHRKVIRLRNIIKAFDLRPLLVSSTVKLVLCLPWYRSILSECQKGIKAGSSKVDDKKTKTSSFQKKKFKSPPMKKTNWNGICLLSFRRRRRRRHHWYRNKIGTTSVSKFRERNETEPVPRPTTTEEGFRTNPDAAATPIQVSDAIGGVSFLFFLPLLLCFLPMSQSFKKRPLTKRQQRQQRRRRRRRRSLDPRDRHNVLFSVDFFSSLSQLPRLREIENFFYDIRILVVVLSSNVLKKNIDRFQKWNCGSIHRKV